MSKCILISFHFVQSKFKIYLKKFHQKVLPDLDSMESSKYDLLSTAMYII